MKGDAVMVSFQITRQRHLGVVNDLLLKTQSVVLSIDTILIGMKQHQLS